MKRVLTIVLSLGIMCSLSLSLESATHFCFIDQIKKIKPLPDTSAFWVPCAPNYFKDRSKKPDLSSWLNVQTHDNFRGFWDLSRNSFRPDFRASEEKDTERDRIRKHRLISGLGLASSWVATVIGDLFYEDGYRRYTLIPVIGPFITIAIIESKNESYWRGAKELLILSGLAQSAFATYFVISLVKHPKPSEAKSVTLWLSFNSINLRVEF